MQSVWSRTAQAHLPVAIDRRKVKVLAAYLTCALCWGTSWYAIRACIQQGGYPTCPAAALRFSLTALAFAALLFLKAKMDKVTLRSMYANLTQLRWIGFAGICSGLGYAWLYMSEEHVSGGLASVIWAMSPLFVAIIAAVTQTEKLCKASLIGLTAAAVGLFVVFQKQLSFSADQGAAVATLLLACVFSSIAVVLIKKFAGTCSVTMSNAVYFTASSATLWIASMCAGRVDIPYPPPMVPTVALLYLTIFGTLVPFAAFFFLLRNVRVSTAMTLSFCTPIIALFADALLERQFVVDAGTFAGMMLVLLAASSAVLVRRRFEQTKSIARPV